MKLANFLVVHYFLHTLLKARHKNLKKKHPTFSLCFFKSTMLELTKQEQYLISKQKHSKISLYLIMLPRQLLLHTHSTNYTHTCTNWLKGCDNYKLKLIIVFARMQRLHCSISKYNELPVDYVCDIHCLRLGSIHIWRQIFM